MCACVGARVSTLGLLAVVWTWWQSCWWHKPQWITPILPHVTQSSDRSSPAGYTYLCSLWNCIFLNTHMLHPYSGKCAFKGSPVLNMTIDIPYVEIGHYAYTKGRVYRVAYRLTDSCLYVWNQAAKPPRRKRGAEGCSKWRSGMCLHEYLQPGKQRAIMCWTQTCLLRVSIYHQTLK